MYPQDDLRRCGWRVDGRVRGLGVSRRRSGRIRRGGQFVPVMFAIRAIERLHV
jgi:hypothetical protein